MILSRRTVFVGLTAAFAAPAVWASAPTAYDFSFTAIDGKPLPLSDYRGQVMLVVNTASFCGFTGQYAGLQSLWEQYKDRGFVLIGVPSNDFGGQEPGSSDEIKDFCETHFQISFPLTEKQQVRGEEAHPFYQWARESLGMWSAPKWNFHKYLIDRDGNLAQSFNTMVSPDGSKLTTAIEALL
ncbi:MAG: glutathione peroxidase [Pseudomonadota bacterium]